MQLMTRSYQHLVFTIYIIIYIIYNDSKPFFIRSILLCYAMVINVDIT